MIHARQPKLTKSLLTLSPAPGALLDEVRYRPQALGHVCMKREQVTDAGIQARKLLVEPRAEPISRPDVLRSSKALARLICSPALVVSPRRNDRDASDHGNEREQDHKTSHGSDSR